MSASLRFQHELFEAICGKVGGGWFLSGLLVNLASLNPWILSRLS